jgi:hypothetical protein
MRRSSHGQDAYLRRLRALLAALQEPLFGEGHSPVDGPRIARQERLPGAKNDPPVAAIPRAVQNSRFWPALEVSSSPTEIMIDNRRSVEKYKPLSYQELNVGHDGIFIDVTLVGGNHGNLITYTYKVEPQPLKVYEIIRVPRP